MSGANLPPLKTRKLGRDERPRDRARSRHCAAGRTLRQDRGRRGGGDHRRRLGRRRALFRYVALVWTRARRAFARPRALPQAARSICHLDQNWPRPPPPARSQRHQGSMARRPRVSDCLRLRLRRRDALVRGQPAAARNQSGRRPADSRPRPLGPQSKRRSTPISRSSRRADGKRSRNCARPGVIGGIGAGFNSMGTHPTLPRSVRHGLLPAGDALHAARAGRARQRVSALRGAGRRDHRRRRLQFRNSRDRRHSRRDVQLRAGRPRDPGAGEEGSRRSARAIVFRLPPRRCNSRSATRSSPRSFPARFRARRSNGTWPPSAIPFPPTSGPNSNTRSSFAPTRRRRPEQAPLRSRRARLPTSSSSTAARSPISSSSTIRGRISSPS